MAAILDFQSKIILAIFYRQVIQMLPTKFQVNWPFGSGEQRKIDFQDGHGRHLGFLIGTISAIFLSTNHPDASYQVLSQPFGFGEEVKNRFSRWQPWRPL